MRTLDEALKMKKEQDIRIELKNVPSFKGFKLKNQQKLLRFFINSLRSRRVIETNQVSQSLPCRTFPKRFIVLLTRF